MVAWTSAAHLEHHFQLHGHEVGARTAADYDESAQMTLTVGRYFSYYDETSEEQHVGCYNPATRRFVAMTEDDLIVTHFVCPAWYVRGLLDSNYDEGE